MLKTPYTLNPKPYTLNQGFTLIEMLVTIGLFMAVAMVGAIIGFDAITRSTVASERDQAVMLLVGARTKAIANVDQLRQGVRIESDQFILFEGDSYAVADPATYRYVERNTNISITPVPSEVVFERLSGDVTAGAGTYTFSDGSQSDDVEINAVGRIEW